MRSQPLGLDKTNGSAECLLPSRVNLFSKQSMYFISQSLWGCQCHAVTVESTDSYPKGEWEMYGFKRSLYHNWLIAIFQKLFPVLLSEV